MQDYALISTAYNNEIRIYVSKTTNLVEQARNIHKTLPTASAALGRFLTVSAMMGLMYKDKDRLTLQIKGDGPINTMLVETNSLGTVRADITNPNVYIRSEKEGKLDVGKAVGKGFLHVTKDLNMKQMFTSSVELVTGEIAEDVANYFLKSEQTPTAVSLGVLVENDQSIRSSDGFIIQVMPDASEETINKVEKAIYDVGPVSRWFDEGHSLEELLKKLSNNTFKLLDKKELKYYCPCSKDGFSKSLSALDDNTMYELIEDNGIEVVCHFCKSKYNFTKEYLINIKTNR